MPAATIMELFWICGNRFKSIDRITSTINSAATECLVLAFVEILLNRSLSVCVKNVWPEVAATSQSAQGKHSTNSLSFYRPQLYKIENCFQSSRKSSIHDPRLLPHYLAPAGFALLASSISELYLTCPEYTISSILSAKRASGFFAVR